MWVRKRDKIMPMRLNNVVIATRDYEAMVEYHNDLDHGFGAHLAVQQENGHWGAGPHLIQKLDQLAAERGIDLRTGHRVSDVVEDEQGAVVGVIAGTSDGDVSLYARKGVVFCTGGYPHDRERTLAYFPGGLYGACAVPTA